MPDRPNDSIGATGVAEAATSRVSSQGGADSVQRDLGQEPTGNSANALLEALAIFVKEKAAAPSDPEPKEQIGARQYAGLALFFSSISLLYLAANSFLPTLVKAPVWQFLSQFVPLALGSYLVAGSKTFQRRLLARAGTARFIIAMAVCILVFGTLEAARRPDFKIPIQFDQDVDSYCSQRVDGVDEVMVAARETPLTTTLPQATDCDSGSIQPGGIRAIRRLQLGEDYMVTVRYHDKKVKRYYLKAATVLKAAFNTFFGFKADLLQFKVVTVAMNLSKGSNGQLTLTVGPPGKELIKVQLDQNANDEAKVRISGVTEASLVHIPGEARECIFDPEDLRNITCTLSPSKITLLPLRPGLYQIEASGCKVLPTLDVKTDMAAADPKAAFELNCRRG